jgi:glucose dehydrogenase
LKWQFPTEAIVRSRPAVANGTVFFSSDDGYLFAVNARTGKQVWKFDMGRPLMERKPIPQGWDYMQSSPVVVEGVIYAGGGNQSFFAVDARTGDEKWHAQIGLYVRSSPAVVDGVVYVGDWTGTLHALDAKTGQLKWDFNTYGPVIPSPTVVDGTVYIGSKFPCLYAIDAATGKKKWCFSFGTSWVESTATVVNGTVYVGSSDLQKVNAVDAATGELKWDFSTEGDPWSSPAVSNGVVYIGSTIGYLYALDAGSGAEIWKVKTDKSLKTSESEPIRFDGGVVSSPTVVDGVVYFGGLDGKLYAVSAN